MTQKLFTGLPARRFPEKNRVILTATCQLRTISVKCYRPYPVGMPCERFDTDTRCRLPEANSTILTTSSEESTSRTKSDTKHAIPRIRNDAKTGTRMHLPETHLL